MSKFEAFEKHIDGIENDEKRLVAIVAGLEEKIPAPREIAARAVGIAKDLVWWDHESLPAWIDQVPQFDDFRAAAAQVPADGFMVCDRAVIPDMVWKAHRAEATAPGGHGLRLADEPAVVALVRNGKDRLGFMIGYKAAT